MHYDHTYVLYGYRLLVLEYDSNILYYYYNESMYYNYFPTAIIISNSDKIQHTITTQSKQ